MQELYADVIIDISHEAIDRAFQYVIPEKLVSQIRTGCQVNIPFGRLSALFESPESPTAYSALFISVLSSVFIDTFSINGNAKMGIS